MTGYSTRTIMIAAAVGVVFGLLLIPANIYTLAMTMTYPLLGAVTWGLWGMAAYVAVGLLRRFGVGILANVVAGLVSGPLTGYGWALAATMLFWGLVIELPFLITRYRRFPVAIFLGTGAFIGLANAAMGWGPLGLGQMRPVIVALVVGGAVASCVLCAWLSYLSVGRLAAAGIGVGPRRSRTP
ncbi:hypothetical protein E1295_10210 [Nonomuraea mesophila]|uniref:ECF transporter S component n=1 Tax=Nonomuraea mesophila TaxID=2530382 RepID=A0A4V2ZBC7_9ACTN|nr:ECF transporter S component [Nonomuraea mesophila]TDE56531.1 hypothetical protein E1295_10210 [Nonomuraea mesophila]